MPDERGMALTFAEFSAPVGGLLFRRLFRCALQELDQCRWCVCEILDLGRELARPIDDESVIGANIDAGSDLARCIAQPTPGRDAIQQMLATRSLRALGARHRQEVPVFSPPLLPRFAVKINREEAGFLASQYADVRRVRTLLE